MISKVPLTLLCSAVLAYACGPRARNEAISRDEPARTRIEGSPLATSFDVSVDGEVKFAFAITNAGKKKLEVNFADGRTHDVVVLDSLGREVWRWSEGRMFTQAMQNRVLRQSDVLEYEESWEPTAPGRYVAVATLVSANYPATERREFVVPKM